MENSQQGGQGQSGAYPGAAAGSAGAGAGAPPFQHLLHQQQQQLQMFWSYQRQEIEHIKDDAALVGATASGVPYYYPPIGQPAGMMIGRPAVDPATGVYVQPPSQAWQSVWQSTADDTSYGGAGGAAESLANEGVMKMLNLLGILIVWN
ncbi:Nuclear transcription factor Y subunit [Vigna angularis]|uniref:Nuclear transcription factor Y subunit n=1 Tax=Phaseolus angularis TaxID=3914 RepID=A0A8T0KH19_PHAAN|nr:Nuclear transcription factor Y subunit [Vigna angularis]